VSETVVMELILSVGSVPKIVTGKECGSVCFGEGLLLIP
jgi:hypothetical protein